MWRSPPCGWIKTAPLQKSITRSMVQDQETSFNMKALFIIGMLALYLPGYTQGKYFEVVMDKVMIGNDHVGKVAPLNNQSSIKLYYKGKHRKQLLDGILKYLKNH